MADNKFTFWQNMRDTIESYSDPVFKYQCYSALTKYGLDRELPEKDGDFKTEAIISLCQSFNTSLQKNWDYEEEQSEKSEKGGNHQLYSNEDLIKAIEEAGIEKNGGKISWEDCAKKYKELFDENSKIVGKTFSRRFSEDKRAEIIQKALIRKNGFDF